MRSRLFACSAMAFAVAFSPPAVAQLQLTPQDVAPPPSGGQAQPPRAQGQVRGTIRQVKPVEPGETPTPVVPESAAPAAPALPSAPGAAPPPSVPSGKAKPGDTVAPGAPDETVIAPPKQKIANSTATFSGLDKITGRIIMFDVAIDETVQFGALQVTPRACYTRPPTETPQTTTFVEVNEVTLAGEIRKQFTGWMFAASPGLSGIEHPVYDVWLADCKQGKPSVPAAQNKTK